MTSPEEPEEVASLNGDSSAPLNAGLSAAQTRRLLDALSAIQQGDFAVRMRDADTPPRESQGAMAEVVEAVDAVSGQLHALALGISRLARATAVEGRLGAQIETGGASGSGASGSGATEFAEPAGLWRDMNTALNNMSHILATQVRALTSVAAAVSEGDLSQKVTVAAAGEMGELKATFNTMIDQLQLLKNSVGQLMEQVQTLNLPHQQPPGDAG